MSVLTIDSAAREHGLYRVTFRDESGARALALFGELYLAGLLAAAQVPSFDEGLVGRRVEARVLATTRADVPFYAHADSFARITGDPPPALARPVVMRTRMKKAS